MKKRLELWAANALVLSEMYLQSEKILENNTDGSNTILSNIKRTLTCSSIGNRIRTPYFILWTNRCRKLNTIQPIIIFTELLIELNEIFKMNQFWKSSGRKHLPWLIIYLMLLLTLSIISTSSWGVLQQKRMSLEEALEI